MHPVSAQSLLLSSSWSRLEKDALLINSVKLTLKCFEAAAVQTSGLVNIVYFSNGEWSTQLWTQLMQLHKKPEKKIQDFNTIWTCGLAIPVQCSNQLSYEATDVGSWSIMCLVRVSHWYHEVTGSNPVEVLYFFSGFLSICINHVHNCEDHSSSFLQILYDLFHIHLSHCLLLSNVFGVQASVYWYKTNGHNWGHCSRSTAIRPGFKTVSMHLTACIYVQALLDAYWKLDWLKNWITLGIFISFFFVGIQSWLHCI